VETRRRYNDGQLKDAVCIVGHDTLVPTFLDSARRPARGLDVGLSSDPKEEGEVTRDVTNAKRPDEGTGR
jgi:hypothetical protein